MQPIFIVAIFVIGFYKFFELIIKRKERIMMIEKFTPQMTAENFRMPAFNSMPTIQTLNKFTSLRVGCILLGVGIGLVIGILYISQVRIEGTFMAHWRNREVISTILTSFVLLFGGLSMIVSFVIESYMLKNEKKRNQNQE